MDEVLPAMAARHEAKCASASLSDHDDDTGAPSSPARSPDSHTTNLCQGALDSGPARVLQQGAKPPADGLSGCNKTPDGAYDVHST